MNNYTLNIWFESSELGCPHLRFHDKTKCWVALDKDPCPKCDHPTCHNVGKAFDQPKRLIIIKREKRQCVVCGREFYPEHENQYYCSNVECYKFCLLHQDDYENYIVNYQKYLKNIKEDRK